ncbi:hypothetical protein NQZ68_036916 [Dissostichus eleginoides]|nr:hypothetical protein NQZ68_036916 [Dissostichus eleginoides]
MSVARESPCPYAIALEAILRAVEESQRGGRPFPDRDCKLTRQLLRGLIDEEVYTRISPTKPLFFSFRELQAELRNLAKESKRFQSQNKAKKTYAQNCNPEFKFCMLPVWEGRTYSPCLQSSAPRSQSGLGTPTTAYDPCRGEQA